jgi:hypothetical protein
MTGAPTRSSSKAVRTPTPGGPPPASSSGWLSSSGSIDHGLFQPGAILDSRYRIIGLLGKGGMGEVYRADDLRLGQQVALKFLPDALTDDPVRLAQFHNEVRTARQISHANICRVHDIGESDGHLYLSMEYVDGEDLATSLRRIGRFPEDKAIEIARQLCAGLAAAHERGVLHRDLKPANVMLDGAGRVRLMDFGLAAVGHVEDVRAGTPAYMAPEQLLGREVTARSDIFALGLVIYELFTGRRAFTAKTIQELVNLHQSGTVTPPTAIVAGIDPAIERAILRCLDAQPERRPSSALAVSAALPGGDPLAAALAAGETPSPEMVAAAGEGQGLNPRVAVSVYAAVLAGFVAISIMTLRLSALDIMRPQFSSEVLAQKARELIAQLGYPERERDDEYGFQWDDAVIGEAETKGTPPDWDAVLTSSPSPLVFWYRSSQEPMTGSMFHSDLLTPGIVDFEDPPPIEGGMISLRTDHRGQLRYFEAMPPQLEEKPTPPAPVDWARVLSLAGLDAASLQETEPQWRWLAASDTRVAWTGTWPGSGHPLRVEAAALGGRPVAFMAMGPWQRPWRSTAPRNDQTAASESGEAAPSGNDTAALLVLACLALLILFGAIALARKNLREGRGDRRSALNLAYFTVGTMLLLWALDVHLVASLGLLATFLLAICTSVFNGVLLWTVYIALEPLVRRRWPQALVSWTTLFSGRVRDPVVGRDVLFGVAMGVVWVLIIRVVGLATGGDAAPGLGAVELLGGVRQTLATTLEIVARAIRSGLFFFLLLFIWRVVLRRQWAAAVAFAAVPFALLDLVGSDVPWTDVPRTFAIMLIAALVAVRWGLVSLAVGLGVTNLLLSMPLSSDLSAWYFGNAMLCIGLAAATATWAFYTSIGGRLWKGDLLG